VASRYLMRLNGGVTDSMACATDATAVSLISLDEVTDEPSSRDSPEWWTRLVHCARNRSLRRFRSPCIEFPVRAATCGGTRRCQGDRAADGHRPRHCGYRSATVRRF